MEETPEQLRMRLHQSARTWEAQRITGAQTGVLVGHLDEICDGPERRRQFLKYIYATSTSKDLTADQWVVLRNWLDPQPIITRDMRPDDKPVWLVQGHCHHEARAVIRAQQEIDRLERIAAGQTSFL